MDDDIQGIDAEAPADLANDGDGIEELPPPDPTEVAQAEEFERQVRAEASEQFKRLKYDAQTIYGLTRGRPGVRSPEQWASLVEKAGDEIGNGQFIVRCLGAERYLEPETVAVLITLRQNLIAENSARDRRCRHDGRCGDYRLPQHAPYTALDRRPKPRR